MSKAKKRNKKQPPQATTQQKWLIPGIGVIALVLLIAAIGLTSMSNDNESASGSEVASATDPQLISPADYVENYGIGADNHILLDVRTPPELENPGYIEGALNIPVQELQARLDELPNDKPIIIYCNSGNRSADAARILDNAGYTNIYDIGGIRQWMSEGRPTLN